MIVYASAFAEVLECWFDSDPSLCCRMLLESGPLLKFFKFVVPHLCAEILVCCVTSACGNLGLSPASNFVHLNNTELLLLLLSAHN